MTSVPRSVLVLWLLALSTVSACSTPERKVDQSARTARSWAATARTTSEALATGAVPLIYARQVFRAALESHRRLRQQSEWHSLPDSTRRQLDIAIRELSSSINRRADSVARQ